MLRIMTVSVGCFLIAGCSSTQLNYNTSDLATSLNSLAKKQIFYNLAQASTDAQFVPSQVIIASGNAQTTNSITPTITLPFATSYQLGNTFGTASNGSFTNQASLAGPGLSLQASDVWNQSWTMSPISDANQIGRLRALYTYVIERNDGVTLELRKRRLLCDYPNQAYAIALDVAGGQFKPDQGLVQQGISASPMAVLGRTQNRLLFEPPSSPQRNTLPGNRGFLEQVRKEVGTGKKAIIVAFNNGNAIIQMSCPAEDGSDQQVFRYADPTFLVGPNCVICIDPTRLGPFDARPHTDLMEVFVTPNLSPGFITTDNSKGDGFIIGSYGSTNFYARVTSQRHAEQAAGLAFSNFILLTYEAMSQTSTSGNGKTNGTASYVLALPR
jgi:hypothetical protein